MLKIYRMLYLLALPDEWGVEAEETRARMKAEGKAFEQRKTDDAFMSFFRGWMSNL